VTGEEAYLDAVLEFWDLPNRRLAHTLIDQAGALTTVAIAPDGRRAVPASWDGTLKVWDLETGRARFALAGHRRRVAVLAMTPDGRYVVSASSDHAPKVWQIETGQMLAGAVLDAAQSAIAVAPDGSTIVAGDVAGNIYCLCYIDPGEVTSKGS